MARAAKLFRNRRSQAIRLPVEFRFEGSEVFIRQDPDTGDVILSRGPGFLNSFFALVQEPSIPKDFVADRGDEPPQKHKSL